MKSLILLALALPLAAQSTYPKHNFSLGVGAGLPGGELTGLFRNSAGITFNYGYRKWRYLQADVGLDTLFGAAGVRDFIPTELGYLRIRDFQFLIPFGGRFVLPVKDGRMQFSAGGGGAYMRYSERLRQPSSYYRFECPDCAARSGWGSYALAGGSYALDRYQRFRLGVTAKLYRGHTDGGALGAVQAAETLDRWINLFADFTVSF
jgi:hypothetical protein